MDLRYASSTRACSACIRPTPAAPSPARLRTKASCRSCKRMALPPSSPPASPAGATRICSRRRASMRRAKASACAACDSRCNGSVTVAACRAYLHRQVQRQRARHGDPRVLREDRQQGIELAVLGGASGCARLDGAVHRGVILGGLERRQHVGGRA
eukprot:7119359-Pyramimonas_sp.AAC.1